MAKSKPWFIHDQQWSVLTATEDRKQYLDKLRTDSSAHDSDRFADMNQKWRTIEDWEDVAVDRSKIVDDQGHPIRFRRLIITSDAGIGKSKATEWLEHRINHPYCNKSTGETAFLFQIRTFLDGKRSDRWSIAESLLKDLTSQWLHECDLKGDAADRESIRRSIENHLSQAARRGELVLIFDGLDQASEDDWKPIFWLLESIEFKRCRFVLAGRSNKICSKWAALNEREYWTYLRVEDFETRQQIRYLGWLPPIPGGDPEIPQGDRVRYNAINRDARRILNVPRVLSYLRERDDFSTIRSACDVYDYAVTNLIEDGLRFCTPKDQRIDNNVVQTMKEVLAVTAYESLMIYQDEPTFQRDPEERTRLVKQPSTAEDPYPEYVYDINHDHGDFAKVKSRIKSRWENEAQSFEDNWLLLGRMNAFLEQGIFENDQEGLNRIVWSNRSLHEYSLALYFAKFARPGEESILWDWIYIHDVSDSEQYYPFWQFLTEMPSRSRDSEAWLRAIELLFWRNVRYDQPPTDDDADNPAHPFFAKRSTEMIYRAWDTLEAYCTTNMPKVKREANRIRDRWWGEFESTFLAGEFGERFQKIARDIQEHLIDIPGGLLHMGTTWEKQVPERYVRGADEQLSEFASDLRTEELQEDAIDRFFSERTASDRASKIWMEEWEPVVRRAAMQYRAADSEAKRNAIVRGYIRSFWQLGNEFELDNIPIEPFTLGRTPVVNRFYRLFDSGHSESRFGEWHKRRSSSENHPAIEVSFFDAWVFCQWMRWNSQSCQLPSESQWEYAAKIGLSDWTQGYWFGDHYDPEQHATAINCVENWPDKASRKTLVPSGERASPYTGLIDMHGNTWEWCQDRYRFRFEPGQEAIDRAQNAFVPRVLRGGSFDRNAFNARCSFRVHVDPSYADLNYGLRVSRARNP